MSRWTHIVGCLYIETHKEQKNIKEYVEKSLKFAPKITGSEKDADMFVNVLSGHNTWTNMDCNNCKYGKTIKHLEEGGFECNAEEGYKCPQGEYQTCIAITIVGDLRDKEIQRTACEIREFIEFIKKDYDIFYLSISIYDEFLGKFDFSLEE